MIVGLGPRGFFQMDRGLHTRRSEDSYNTMHICSNEVKDRRTVQELETNRPVATLTREDEKV